MNNKANTLAMNSHLHKDILINMKSRSCLQINQISPEQSSHQKTTVQHIYPNLIGNAQFYRVIYSKVLSHWVSFVIYDLIWISGEKSNTPWHILIYTLPLSLAALQAKSITLICIYRIYKLTTKDECTYIMKCKLLVQSWYQNDGFYDNKYGTTPNNSKEESFYDTIAYG